MSHQFQVGQAVRYSPSGGDVGSEGGNYTVVRLLPLEAGEFQYHVEHAGNGHRRRVLESQLRTS